jgi:hypothetical protein
MDRVTIYSQEIPRSADFLQGEQSAMVALAKLSDMVLGTSTMVDGLTCVPNSPAALNVLLNPGQIYSLANLEATTWSAINADTTHQILKQGVALNQQTIAITPPVTSGFSQVYLIEVQYADLDTSSVVLPYFNSANPSVPLTGPGGAGTPQNTLRSGIVSVQLKAGTAATTGTQVAPSVDAGWTGLWLITVAQGQATITAGNIVEFAGAPFIANANNSASAKLTQVPAVVQAGVWGSGIDIGAANAYAVSLSPNPGALTGMMELRVRVANTNTGASTIAVNGGSALPIVHSDQTALNANDLTAGQIAILLYDAVNNNFQVPRATVDPSTVATTADVKWQPNSGALTGWVRINGRTIGNAVSGATEFASSTALALYTYIWTNYSNTRCPVTGGRGASAAADFSGGKPIALLDMRGRSPFGLDDMGSSTAGRILNSNVTSAGDSATAPAGTGGEANHVLTVAELAAHSHGITDPQHTHSPSFGGSNFVTTSGGTAVGLNGSGTLTQQNLTAGASTGITINSNGSSTAHNTMAPFMLGTWYWKL